MQPPSHSGAPLDDRARSGSDDEWWRSEGVFRVVHGYQEAASLLNDPRIESDIVRIFEAVGVTEGPLWESMASSFLSLNGAEHKRYRSAIAREFTPRKAERIRPTARATANDLIDSFAASGTCELIHSYAGPYVGAGICEFVGFPLDEVGPLSAALYRIALAFKDLHNRIDLCAEGVAELVAYAKQTLELRQSNPPDQPDVLSVISAAVEDGTYPETVAWSLIAGLLSAGHEPTINQLGLMVHALSHRPELWNALGSGAIEPRPLVEELLRYESTNRQLHRQAAETVECPGLTFRAHDNLLIDLERANHDPRRFPNPDDVDIAANQGPHLAFGFGPHHCLGAAVARVQLQEGLLALAQRLTVPEVVEIVPDEGAGLKGYRLLTVGFHERRPSPT
ncbi:MAG: cytochrome P450 [Aquihabitans sp.]